MRKVGPGGRSHLRFAKVDATFAKRRWMRVLA